jgi:hypothetical protein
LDGNIELENYFKGNYKKNMNLQGNWDYQSFLILPSDEEWALNPETSVTAKKWAKGTLVIVSNTDNEFSGELIFTETVKLRVKGKILPATKSNPAVLDAVGEATEGLGKGAIYKISGWINPLSPNQTDLTQVNGSVLAVRGPDSSPEKELGGMPIGTVGAFVLVLV